jgi:hypothetical protein
MKLLQLYSQLQYIKSSVFWDIRPCSPLKVNRRSRGTCHFHLHVKFLLGFSSTLRMEATCSSETSVDSQRTTWRYIPEDRTLHNHRCENLKSDTVYVVIKQHIIMDDLTCF